MLNGAFHNRLSEVKSLLRFLFKKTPLSTTTKPFRIGLNQDMESPKPQVQAKDPRRQMGLEEKKVLLHEEMKRMNKLPANSSYATHRMRVLNKILQLLSVQRTMTEDQELELLFAGLSL